MSKFLIRRFGNAIPEKGEVSYAETYENAYKKAAREARVLFKNEKDSWADLEMEEADNLITVVSGSDTFYAAWYICAVPETKIDGLKMFVEFARIGLASYVALLDDPYTVSEHLDAIETILGDI